MDKHKRKLEQKKTKQPFHFIDYSFLLVLPTTPSVVVKEAFTYRAFESIKVF